MVRNESISIHRKEGMGYEKRQSVSIEKDYKKLEMVRSPQMEEVTVDKN